jgi:ferrochelatase
VSLISRTCRDAHAKIQQRTTDRPHLLLTAHGVPQRYIRAGDTYQREVEETASLVQDRLASEFATIHQGYQSGLGPVKWLEPESGGLVKRIGREGGRALVLSPLGFVSDHIETLYDMDTLFAQTAREAGIATYERVPSFNADAEFTRLLATISRGVTQPFEVDKWTS